MAIIYSYPTVTPTKTDLILGTDVSTTNKSTKNFTVQSIIDLVTIATGDLQTVLDLGFIATGRDIVLGSIAAPSQTIHAGTFTTGPGLVVLSGTTATGFTNIISTLFTGTLATPSQPDITSLGTLTSLAVNTSVTGTAVVTTLTAPGDDLKIASTKAIVDYIATKPAKETLAETLVAGNVTGGTNITVSAGDNITFTDTSKALFGSGQDLEVNNDGIDSFITDLSTGDLRLRSDDAVKIQASTGGNTLATFTKGAGVDLYFANAPIFETLATGAKVTGAFQATTSGTFASLINTGTYTAGNGVGTAGQILSSTGTGTSWVTETPLYSWQIEGDSGAVTTVADGDIIHFKGMNDGGTPLVGITTAFVPGSKELRITANGLADGDGQAGQVAYWSGTGLTSTLTGDTGMTYDAATDNLTVAGIIQGGTLSDGTFSGSTGTYTGGVNITSAKFTVDATAFDTEFRGNASSATRLGTANGTIQLSAGSGATLGVGSDAVIYTDGGDITLTTTLASTTVTSKLLTGISFSTGTNVAATDTILEGVGKLQKQITDLPAGLDYIGTWDASGGGGGVPDLTVAATHVPGQYYICSADSPAGGTFPNGGAVEPSEWKIGDWCIRGDAQNDVWQKIDNTAEVTTDGSGVATVMPVWNNASELGSSQVHQVGVAGRTVTTIVDGGAGGDLTVEGNTILGSAIGDVTTVAGPLTANKNIVITEGISLGTASTFGTAGQVLTSGGGLSTANTWTDISTWGYVESVSGGTGITVSGTAVDPIVNIDYVGTDNAILSATQYLGTADLLDTDVIWFNDASNAVANTVSYAQIGSLPFDEYNYWTLSDDTTTVNISSTDTAKILGGTGITSVVSPTDKSATLSIDYVGADNAILSAGAGTPIATDELWFNNADVASGTVQRASIASIVDLGNETLAQVLTNGNTTGGTKILVNADDASGGGISLVDDAKIRFSTNGHMQLYGTGTENRIYNNGAPLRISVAGGGYSGSVIISKGVGAAAETMAEFNTDGSVDLYYDAVKKFETTSTGVSVTGNLLVSNGTKGNLFLGPQTGTGTGNDSEITSNHSLYIDYAKLTGTSGNFYISNNTTTQLTIQGSTGKVVFNEYGSGTITGTPTYNLEVDSSGNIIETPSTNPGGNGGTFSGSKDIDAGGVIKVFTLTRATTGCLVFDVFFTADFVSGVGGGPPIAEKWTVVHGNSQTPVYNKIISNDGQFGTGGYDVTFADASSGTAVECSVAQRSGSSYPSLSYTIIVGYSENNALTFTPA